MSETSHYQEMFNYLSSGDAPEESADILVVAMQGPERLNREDLSLVHAAGTLVVAGLAERVVISGLAPNVNDDLGIAHAMYLRGALGTHYPETRALGIQIGTTAEDVTEAIACGLSMVGDINTLGLQADIPALTVVAHAVSLRRSIEMVRETAIRRGTLIENIYGVPTDTKFDAADPKHQQKVQTELRLLAYMSRTGQISPSAFSFQTLVNPNS